MRNESRRAFTKLSIPLALLAVQLACTLFNTLRSQTSTDNALPKFEVVSIRPSNGNCPSGSGLIPSGDTLRISCLPLDVVIKIAYGVVPNDLITGEPEWAKSTSFDISAKVDSSDTAAFDKLKLHDFGLMLQPVLEDRFKLRTHYETRQRTVYALTVANGGPKLKTANPDPSGNNTPLLKMTKWGEIECSNCSIGGMPVLLSQLVNGKVTDETGLKGNYDFTLSFAPDPTKADDTRPSIFTAIQEQLGLKFVPKKESVSVLVIDHVEQPSPN